jgi:hypothetical protein
MVPPIQSIGLLFFGKPMFECRVVVWIRIRRGRITGRERSLDCLIEGRVANLSFFVRSVLMFDVVGRHYAPPDESLLVLASGPGRPRLGG